MAHIAKLGALTEELIVLLTSTSPQSDPSRFHTHRESALRAFRHSHHPRTDPFDVASRLRGLEEKFRVYNEDPLADALRDGVARASGKWAPEVLCLLLELSEKPLQRREHGGRDVVRGEEGEGEEVLKWADVVKEDPLLREESVWGNVDFGAESEEDYEGGFEEVVSDGDGATDTTGWSSVEDEPPGWGMEGVGVEAADEAGLEEVLAGQFWKRTPSVNGVRLETVKKPLTELQAVREVLFMLSGLPTSLFGIDPKDSNVVTPSKDYALKHLTTEAFQNLASELAHQGSAVMVLRSWVKRPQNVPLMQVLQHSITERIRSLDGSLANIQRRFVAPPEDVVVSLLRVKVEVSSSLRPLVQLSQIIQRLDAEPYSHAFRYLELLYDETCTSQMAGDEEIYSFIGRLFFDCFEVYLRPIRTWMEDGELGMSDTVFFVSEAAATTVQSASVWQYRFKIRRTQDGILHAPRFLRAAAKKIFTTGKSVVVLKHLNQFESLQCSRATAEPKLDFDTVCNPTVLQLAPFSELFDTAFENWVQSKHHYASSTLRKTLFDACGLHSSLKALSHIYFMEDGATAATFTNPIFDKLDTLDESWNDHFTVTELAQSSFGSLSPLSSDRLRTSIRPIPKKYRDVATCRRSVKALAAIQVNYHLSWPIQIILTLDTMSSYQRIFTFLLQVRRTSHILSRERPGSLPSTSAHEGVLYFALRSRLLWFTSTLYYYLTSLVIGPSTQAMLSQLEAATDVDGMIQVHAAYVKAALSQSLLGTKLELIHKSILKILDLGIKLEDARALHMVRERELEVCSEAGLASLGLRSQRQSLAKSRQDPEGEDGAASDDEREVTVDLSILSSTYDEEEREEDYREQLRRLKDNFDTQVRFVTRGLRGVARAGEAEQARHWDVLAEMLEGGVSATERRRG